MISHTLRNSRGCLVYWTRLRSAHGCFLLVTHGSWLPWLRFTSFWFVTTLWLHGLRSLLWFGLRFHTGSFALVPHLPTVYGSAVHAGSHTRSRLRFHTALSHAFTVCLARLRAFSHHCLARSWFCLFYGWFVYTVAVCHVTFYAHALVAVHLRLRFTLRAPPVPAPGYGCIHTRTRRFATLAVPSPRSHVGLDLTSPLPTVRLSLVRFMVHFARFTSFSFGARSPHTPPLRGSHCTASHYTLPAWFTFTVTRLVLAVRLSLSYYRVVAFTRIHILHSFTGWFFLLLTLWLFWVDTYVWFYTRFLSTWVTGSRIGCWFRFLTLHGCGSFVARTPLAARGFVYLVYHVPHVWFHSCASSRCLGLHALLHAFPFVYAHVWITRARIMPPRTVWTHWFCRGLVGLRRAHFAFTHAHTLFLSFHHTPPHLVCHLVLVYAGCRLVCYSTSCPGTRILTSHTPLHSFLHTGFRLQSFGYARCWFADWFVVHT